MKSRQVIDQLLDSKSFTPAIAKELIKLKFDPATEIRLEQLAEKSNEGSLSSAERSEYESIVQAFDIIGVLRGQAQSILSRRRSE